MIQPVSLDRISQIMRDRRLRLEEDWSELTRLWVGYFEEYNKDPQNKHLGMGCVPCYQKVYLYLKNKENANT